MVSLPESYSDADLGRVRTSAAKVLLAKVYMTENKFAQAEPILKAIIDANTYSLQTDITKVFAITSEMSSEVIFSIRFSKTLLGGGHGAWFSLSDVSISEISASFTGAYAIADARLNLIKYTKNGSVYYINKFIDTPDATTKNLSNDYIVLRYADVLLMYAECLNENLALSTDPASGALYYLNLVRKRSFATGAILPSQYANKNELRNIILKERRLEFPLEGNRWFDLVRTNTAKSQILANSGSGSPAGLLAPLAVVADIPDFRLIYPVPNAEVEKINNKDIFPQNIGY
jgi:hypothetical protein